MVPLLGIPMIIWVASASAKAVGFENVIVATEDKRICEVVQEFGFTAQMTSPDALTGTDRVAEVARNLGRFDTILNVQGDEPLVLPEDILAIAQKHREVPELVVNGYSAIQGDEDATSVNVPKLVMDDAEKLLYISRLPIPGSKDPSSDCSRAAHYKQVCIYAYSQNHLSQFVENGRKTPLESREDIEILRFLELGQAVQMVRTSVGSLAIDTPEDVQRVEVAMKARGLQTIPGFQR